MLNIDYREALHESAHAVMAWRLGLPVVSIEIGPQRRVDHGVTWWKQKAGLVACVEMAGPLADQRAFGLKVAMEGAGELIRAGAVLEHLARRHGVDGDRVVDVATKFVRHTLNRRWAELHWLAGVLSYRGKLSGDEARRIFERGE